MLLMNNHGCEQAFTLVFMSINKYLQEKIISYKNNNDNSNNNSNNNTKKPSRISWIFGDNNISNNSMKQNIIHQYVHLVN